MADDFADFMQEQIDSLSKALEQEREKVRVLRECLEFYSMRSNYQLFWKRIVDYETHWSMISIDYGKKARAALEQVKGEK